MRFFTFYEIALDLAAIDRSPRRLRNQLNAYEITVAVVVDANFDDHIAGLSSPTTFVPFRTDDMMRISHEEA